MVWRLQPHGIEVMEAATTRDRGCRRVRVDGVDAVDGHALAVVALEVGGQYLVEVTPTIVSIAIVSTATASRK